MTEPALKGLRVTDFSWVYAGPLCTRYLASLGAEVIKIESQRRPDQFRVTGMLRDESGKPSLNKAPGFNLLSYSKKSVSLDLSKPEGIVLAKRLIEISDLVVENYGPGVMEKMGLSYEEVRKIKPDIIMVSSSGMGRTGPQSHYVAYGQALQANSGLTYITGYPGGPPRGVSAPYSDPLTGTTEVLGILAALYHRRMTGEGQYLDLSMTEATITNIPEATLDYLWNGRSQEVVGNDDPIMAPHNVYPCLGDDRWVAIAVSNEEEWQGLCKSLGEPAWTKDERFADQFLRWQHRAEMDKHIGEWTKDKDRYDVMRMLQEQGVPAGPVFDAQDTMEDPHLNARGLFIDLNHAEVGPKRYIGVPWHLSPDSSIIYEPPPLLGQDSEYVLKDLLKLSDSEYKQLVAEEVIY